MHYNHWYSIALLSQKVSKQFYLKDPKKGINLPGERARCRRLRCQNEGGIIYSSDLNFIHAIIGFTQIKHQINYSVVFLYFMNCSKSLVTAPDLSFSPRFFCDSSKSLNFTLSVTMKFHPDFANGKSGEETKKLGGDTSQY